MQKDTDGRESRLSRKAVGIALLGVVFAGFVALMAWGLMNKSSFTGKSGLTRLNKPADDFTLPLFDGDELTLSEQLGRPLVINFWASWCAPCRVEARGLERAWRKYRDEDVRFVGVQSLDAEADGRAYLKEFGVTYPNVIDVGGKVTVDYGVIGLPVTFFVGKSGTIDRRWVGAIDEGRLNTWIEELVSGVPATGQAEGENLQNFFEFK